MYELKLMYSCIPIITDVVYVGTLNEYHYSVTFLMLENGKNVLCEVPFCQNSNQVKNLVEVIHYLCIKKSFKLTIKKKNKYLIIN